MSLRTEVEKLIKSNGGTVEVETPESSIILKETEDGEGFVCTAGPAIYLYDKLDAMWELVKKCVDAKGYNYIYIGGNTTKAGYRYNPSIPLSKMSLNEVIAGTMFSGCEGKSLARWCNYIAPVLQAVGYGYREPANGAADAKFRVLK